MKTEVDEIDEVDVDAILEEQYLFRLMGQTEMGQVFRMLLDHPKGLTKEELGKKLNMRPGRAGGWASKVGQSFDNVQVNRRKKKIILRYTPITPVIDVQTMKVGKGPTVSASASADEVQMLWPSKAPVPSPMKGFAKPDWYERVLAMTGIGKHVSIAGPPGSGKSTGIEQMASEEGKPLVNIGADAGLRRRDLVGQMVDLNTYEVGAYAAAAIHGWWVKIDEVNAAEPDAVIFMNGQLAPPYVVNIKGQAYPVHKDFRLFVTYNPGLLGTKPVQQAFKDRFYSIKAPFPSRGILGKFLSAAGMSKDWPMRDRWLDVAYSLVKLHDEGKIRYQITPRRLIDAFQLVELGLDPRSAMMSAIADSVDRELEVQEILRVLESVPDRMPGEHSDLEMGQRQIPIQEALGLAEKELAANMKIEALKIIRSASMCSLKDAKAMVDHYDMNGSWDPVHIEGLTK